MNLFDLSGKSAIVTGTSGKLGPVWVETLLNANARVHPLDLPEYDVGKIEDVQKFDTYLMFKNGCVVSASCGPFRREPKSIPNIIINNAGIDNPPGSDASFFGNCEEILHVNLQGAVNMCEVFIPDMIKNGGGVIVNIGSIQGNIGADWRNYPDKFEKPVGYNLSKAGLIQLSRSITVQYGRYNIRAVTIAFGPYDMGLDDTFKDKFLKNVPLGRCISKESLQTTLLYAICCPELAGQQVLVDAGYTAW